MINNVFIHTPIAASTMLGICAIPVITLYVQPTCVLCCRAWCHMLCYALHSQRDPYTPPHQTGHTPVDITSTKLTNLFPHPWGPVCAPGHTQGITDRTVGGLATC